MTRKFMAIVIGMGMLLSTSMLAHHSVVAEFDFDKPIEVKGTLSRIEWINPHSYLHLDVKNDKGEVTSWSFETVGITGLKQNGLRNSGITIGETYVFKGLRGRNGQPIGFLQEVTFPDGRKLVVWAGEANAN
jgi:hypothetical protein